MNNKLRCMTLGLVCSFLAMATIVDAQDQEPNPPSVKVGFRVGVLMSKQEFQNGSLDENVTSKLGGDLALIFDFPAGSVVSFSPEFHWLQKGAKIETFGGPIEETTRTFNYLEIPMLLKLHFGQEAGFFLLGGPSVGYLLNGSDKDHDGNTNDIDLDFYKRTEFGAHVGGGIALGAILIDIRYIFGLSNIFDDDSDLEVTNRSLGAGLSLMF